MLIGTTGVGTPTSECVSGFSRHKLYRNLGFGPDHGVAHFRQLFSALPSLFSPACLSTLIVPCEDYAKMASTDWEYQKRLKKENERRERELAKRERELAEREKEHQRRQEAARIAERERQAARRSTYQDREQRQSRYRPRDRDDFYEYGDEGYIDLPYPEPAYGGRHEPPRYREGPRRPQATREHSSGNSRAMIPQMQTKQPGRREEMSMMAPNGGNATKEFDEKRIEQAGVGHRNEFSHGLFKCFDEPGLCCYAWVHPLSAFHIGVDAKRGTVLLLFPPRRDDCTSRLARSDRSTSEDVQFHHRQELRPVLCARPPLPLEIC